MNSFRSPASAGLVLFPGSETTVSPRAPGWRCLVGAAGLLCGAVGSPAAIVFSDSFEAGAAAWVAGGTWNLTTEVAASPTHSATDSPGSFYANDTDASATLAVPVSLEGRERPVLAFRHSYSLEKDYDFGRVEVSADGGATWSSPLATYSGEVAALGDEQLELSAFGSATNFTVRFRLLTDDSVVRDGWHVDDVRIGEAPAPVTLAAPSAVARTSLALSWSEAAGSFSSYEIYRSAAPGLDWRSAWRVGTVSAQATTAYTDVTVSPKSTYYYRLVVVDADGLRTASNEVSATTLAGMDFPLLDNGEGGGRTWVADAPWALSNEIALSGAQAWNDSPGANYAAGIASQALTLAAPVNLSAAADPVLSFNHRHAFASGDYGLVEVSTNNGADWSALATFGGASSGWLRGRVSLAAHRQAAVLVRFRLTSDAGDTADGWCIDDISLSEAPATVPVPVVIATGSTSVGLSWQANADPMFSHYLVVRSEATGVGLNSTLVAQVVGAANTTCTDTGLLLDTVYYYRVYAVNTYGGISTGSATEAQVRTLNNPPPFAENFEAGLSAWLLTGNWALTSEASHGGAQSLTDSPNASYAPGIDTFAETSVDLRGTTWPVLTFWDRYAMGAGDWMRVEVYDTEGAVSQRYIYGSYDVAARTEWRRQQIDLSQFKGRSNVRIRFRVGTDWETPADGWFIDDVSVTENPLGASPLTLPLADSFELATDNWQAAGWSVQTDVSAPEGSHSLLDTEFLRTSPYVQHWLTLARPLVLAAGSNVQVTFRLRGTLQAGSYFRLYYSTDGGLNWPELTDCNLNGTYDSGGWGQLQASLQNLAGSTVRLRLVTGNDGGARIEDIWIDKVTIAEMPAAVTLTSAVPAVRSVTLAWTSTTLGAAFQRYEVWRATVANVTVANRTKLFESADPAATGFVDTGLAIGEQYFYRVIAVDDRDTYIPSNEMAATTIPATLPLVDAMDTTANWVAGQTGGTNVWGICTDNPHSGSGCLAVAPTGQYENSADTWMETAVNLTGLDWPVLTFWDRYAMGGGDWMRVEVIDADGVVSQRYLYGSYDVATRTEWRRQQIDLSLFKGRPNVRIRFRVGTDWETPGDGWFIDDVSVAENPLAASPLTLPLTDSFESGTGNWQAAGWSRQTDASAPDGAHSVLDTEFARTSPSAQHWLTLARPVVLPAGSNVQVTFRLRGTLQAGSWFRLYYSTDGGLSWPELTACNLNGTYDSGGWTQLQASLQSLAGNTVRLRLATGNDGGARIEDIWIDKVTIAEMPAAVTLSSAVPAVRSVALTWTPTALGAAFQRYEVWRATVANVTVANRTKLFESADPATTAFTDTGLAIGEQYFYRVVAVDDRDTYIPSNEMSATTVPATLPLVDDMDTAANWVAGTTGAANTWGICTDNPHSGSGCLAVAPTGQYENSADTWMETAVNLTGLDWPVLTFWDRFEMGAGDWTRIEVIDADGVVSQRYLYGSYDVATRTEWRRQQIDLSLFKGRPNIRIRFRVGTDGATPAKGWFIDEVSVVENPLAASSLALPLTDSFEDDTDSWQAAGWSVQPDASAPDGARSLLDTALTRPSPYAQHWLTLARPVVLAAGSNVQMTLRYRGTLQPGAWFRLYSSTDGGKNWVNPAGCVQVGTYDSGGWQQMQASLQSLAGKTVRLAIATGNDNGARFEDIWIDKVTIAEMPAAVTLTGAVPTLRSVALTWTGTTIGESFRRYELWRGTAENVTVLSGTKVFTSTDPAATAFTDTALATGERYYYRVFTVDARDMLIPSNELAALTVPAILPMADPMDSADRWVPGTTGAVNTWGVCADNPHSGTGCLAVAPVGQYANSAETWMETAVDLTGINWPVLTFWDRYEMGGGDWTRVEVLDADGVVTQRYLYGTYDVATRTEWRRQQIDLSVFKGRSNIRIRFRVGTDGATPAKGWFIDDVSVTENPTGAQALVLPFLDSFENGTDRWQAASWNMQADASAPDGTHSLLDTDFVRVSPYVWHYLTLARPVVLPVGSNVQVAFRLRGTLQVGASFRLHYSTDGGLNWVEFTACNHTGTYDSGGWVRHQVSLASLAGRTVRLRLGTYSDNGARIEDIWIDSFGVGESAPLAPELASPIDDAWVPVVRPTLSVANALDPQSDPLTYRFEVYSDAALTTLVAQVPAVASGADSTSWLVDTNLANNTQYWWRACASDGTNIGAWSTVETFYVNEVNHPPSISEQLGPSAGAILFGDDDWLFWRESTDGDAGDRVIGYHIQTSKTSDFTAVVVDDATIVAPLGDAAEPSVLAVSLSALAGANTLEPGAAYYWRIRARDNRLGWSEWQTEPKYFRYFTTAPTEFQHWQAAAFTITELNAPSASGESADPDSDGLCNLLEFAFGKDPAAAESAAQPVVRVVGGYLQITYRQLVGGVGSIGVDYTARDLRYTVEVSTTMGASSWLSGASFVELVAGSVVDNGDGTETVTVRAKQPITATPRQFLRLNVSTVAP